MGGRYFEAARINGELGEDEEALRCARMGSGLDRYCLGVDHPEYEAGIRTIASMSSKKRRLRIGRTECA